MTVVDTYRKCNMFLDCSGGEQVGDLERSGETMTSPPVRRPSGYFLAPKDDASAVWTIEAGYQMHQRGLTRTVGSHEGDSVTGIQTERNMLYQLRSPNREGDFVKNE